jgi:hypothetical protein
MKFQSAGTFTHSGRRWNILAVTENYIGALELPTGQCVPRPEPRCDHGRIDMSATGLDVFDKTLQTTNHHLDPHQVEKVRQALSENIRALWPTGAEARPFEPAAWPVFGDSTRASVLKRSNT